ncbi:AAA family ATPase [Kineococcus glutinatus]|uniref:AAA family ATPase n=1 Tax=Kineococcus glutinatus TaxID=1070872 RepID=A0ABP9HKV0_9ACTN
MPVPQPPYLLRLKAKNFRSLRDVDLALGAVNVLVGPNGAGKSNLLDVIQFLGDSVRLDIVGAVQKRGGFDRVLFRGKRTGRRREVQIGIEAAVTKNSNRKSATDNYDLSFSSVRIVNPRTKELRRMGIRREESFLFKRTTGPGRRINLTGSDLTVITGEEETRKLDLSEGTLALATLPRLGPTEGGEQVGALADLFASFRVFDVDVMRAREPSIDDESDDLKDDASNLSAFLRYLKRHHSDVFDQLLRDARQFIPGLESLDFIDVGGTTDATYVALIESGLEGHTPLVDASYGSIRALALLALLYDPNPPRLTCIEEIDHGLHPYVLDRLVELIRGASKKTQFIIATHSPSLVNRLRAEELVVCQRGDEGESLVPAIDPRVVREMEDAGGGELGLGELWFSGVLGGVPE